MSIPTPVFIPQPFANNAAAPYINTIPDTGGVDSEATWNIGFPPLTMQEEASGGLPPLGQDFNGILNALSTHVFAQQAGQPYRYSSAVSTAIGGYPVGTLLESSDGATMWFNTTAANTGDPDANAAGWVPMFNYGYTTKAGLTGGVVTLTRLEARRGVIVLTGTLVANLQLVLPNTLQTWLIVNATTGAFVTTAKTAAGSGVTIPQGGYSAPTGVYGEGANIFPTVAPLGAAIDQAPTPLSIAQRTNAGYLLATFFNQSSGLELPAVGAIFVQNVAADGYLRKISIANFEAQLILSNIGGQVANAQVPQSAVLQHSVALFLNAALTGSPTAPTQAPGTNNTTIASTAFVAAAGIGGIGQVWADVTASRALSTPYTNSTGRTIQVNIQPSISGSPGGTVNVYVDSVQAGTLVVAGGGAVKTTISVLVPPGSVYQVNQSGSLNSLDWFELA